MRSAFLTLMMLASAPWLPGAQEPSESSAAGELGPERQQQDERIEFQLRSIFGELPEFRLIQVDVGFGVVHLTGTVPSTADQARAEEVAQMIDGVILVQNRLETPRELESQISPALNKARQLLNEFLALLPLLIIGILIIALAGFLAFLVGLWEKPYQRFSANAFIQTRLRQLFQLAVFLTGLLLALEILGVTAIVGAILGTAGIAGIILGFAFKEIIENYLAGLLLSFHQPFAPNDHILLGDHEGKVLRLTSRETLLMTLDGNHVRIPNARVFNGALVNYTRNPLRRFHFTAGVGTAEDLREVQRVGLGALQRMEGVMAEPPPFFRIENLGDSSVTVRFFGWVDQRHHDFSKVRSEAIRQVKAALDEAGLELPDPTYRLRILDMDSLEMRKTAELPRRHPMPASEEKPDVRKDDFLDDQLDEDRRQSKEVDLLKSESPPGLES